MTFKLLAVFVLFVPSLASAALFQTPSGKFVEAEHQVWIEKVFILPSGAEWRELVPLSTLKYLATGLVPVAKATTLTLREEIELWLRSYSETYDIPQLYDLAVCESNLDDDVLGDKGKAKGLFQWWEKSWNYYNKKYKTNLNRDSWRDQLDMTVKVLQEPRGYENWLNCWSYIKYKTWNKKLWK